MFIRHTGTVLLPHLEPLELTMQALLAQLRSAQGWARAAWRRTEGSGRWGGAAGGGPGAGDPKATAVEGSGDRATAWQSGSAPTWSPRRMIWGSRTTIRTQNR